MWRPLVCVSLWMCSFWLSCHGTPSNGHVAYLTYRPHADMFSWVKHLNKHDFKARIFINDRKYNASLFSPDLFSQMAPALRYRHSTVVTMGWDHTVTAWDDALYYYSSYDPINGNDHVWFAEDDVFISSPDLLKRLNSKHGPECDLITEQYESILDDPLTPDTSKNATNGVQPMKRKWCKIPFL